MVKRLLILVCALIHTSSFSEEIVYYADAFKDKELIYQEFHKLQFKNEKLSHSQVNYLDGDKKLIAKLTHDFSNDELVPEHLFEDYIHHENYGLRKDDSQWIMFLRSKDKKEDLKKIPFERFKNETVIASQGLHYYILKNFDSFILNKDEVNKDHVLVMLIPFRLDWFRLKLKYLGNIEGEHRFVVTLNNWFLRLFTSKIKMNYNSQKQLISYEGLSNLYDPKKNMQTVHMKYIYSKE